MQRLLCSCEHCKKRQGTDVKVPPVKSPPSSLLAATAKQPALPSKDAGIFRCCGDAGPTSPQLHAHATSPRLRAHATTRFCRVEPTQGHQSYSTKKICIAFSFPQTAIITNMMPSTSTECRVPAAKHKLRHLAPMCPNLYNDHKTVPILRTRRNKAWCTNLNP